MRKVLVGFMLLTILVFAAIMLRADDAPALPDYSGYEVYLDNVQARSLLHPERPIVSATFYDNMKADEVNPNFIIIFTDEHKAPIYAEWVTKDRKVRGYARKDGAWVFDREGLIPKEPGQ